MNKDAKRHMPQAPTLVAPDAEPSQSDSMFAEPGAKGDREEDRVRALSDTLAAVKGVLDVTLNNVEQGILMIDADHYVRLYNKKFVDLLEIPKRVLTNPLHFQQILEYQWSVGEFGGVSEDIASWIRSGGIFKSPPVYERRRPNGAIVEVRTAMLDDGGAVRTFSDITDRYRKEEALKRAEAEYRSLFENAVVGIYRSTLDGRQLRANPALVQLNGYSSEAEMLASVNDIAREWYVDPKRRDQFLHEMRTKGRVTDFVSEVYRHRTREKIWVSETAWCVRSEHGQPVVFEGTVLDASARMHSEAKIAFMAHHDTLTGLPNRAYLTQRIEDALRDVRVTGRFAVHYLDLDRFKEVNDTLGHAAGDTLLRLAGRRLKKCVRATDLVARLGGDEFAVIQFGVCDGAEAEELAARIVRSLGTPFRIGPHYANVGASVGIAIAPGDGYDVQALIKNADIALYEAKAAGRRIYRRFLPSMEAGLQERRQIEVDLRGALSRGEFIVEFQPVISLANGETEGFEALIRWQRPQRGQVEPSVFIPIAEEIGIIEPIGEWVLREASRQVACLPGTPYVAVNLSPFQFRSRNIVKTIISAIASAGLPASRLVLEITETVLLRDDRLTRDALHHLRQLGARIALDDFGAGHSSLHYLQKFQFDKFKIDRSFISAFEKDRAASAVVRAVINMGRDLGVSVIAEGVETKRQLEGLKTLGCHAAQGFFLGEPRAIDDWIAATDQAGYEPSAPLAAPSEPKADTLRFRERRATSS
ncbi:MAG TPA: EAL domain-containing protein [Beijerinckiaceae bacterium]|jgi:diguanylate cyclase (GGDEF)-like protein/PAS domain S-box-containing protein|nr:EAL domain-containing protein [Beijerinckiaceae bacterium]